MADYTTKGNKTIKCTMHREITVPLNSTGFLCPNGCEDCPQNHIVLISYYGTVTDIDGNYVY